MYKFLYSINYFLLTFYLLILWQIIEGIIFIKKNEYRKYQISKRKIFRNLNRLLVFKILTYGNLIRLILSFTFIIFNQFLQIELYSIIIYFLIFQSFYNYFTPLIIDISDKLALIITFGLFLGFILDKNLALIFISLNVVLIYFFTGLKKLYSKEWRNGEALFLITNTEYYGNYHLAKLFNNSKVTKIVISWYIILIQLSFPLLFLDIRLLFFYLLNGIIFHFSLFVIMRLYNFFIVFIMSYPSIIYVYYFINNCNILK